VEEVLAPVRVAQPYQRENELGRTVFDHSAIDDLDLVYGSCLAAEPPLLRQAGADRF
jgi:hypothetical protein